MPCCDLVFFFFFFFLQNGSCLFRYFLTKIPFDSGFYSKGDNLLQEMLYVVPFVAKVIESSAKSKVFKPPNPWVMAIMSVLVELHQMPDLKVSLLKCRLLLHKCCHVCLHCLPHCPSTDVQYFVSRDWTHHYFSSERDEKI